MEETKFTTFTTPMSPEEWNKLTSKEKLEVAKLEMRILSLEDKMKNIITKEVLQDNIKEALKKKKADMSKLDNERK